MELTHVYTSTGVYDVRLVVTDTVGASGEAMLQIVVDPAALVDRDEDGVSAPADCDDTNAAIYPGASESCNDVDDDCDGLVDDGLQRACCGAGVAMCTAGAWSACSVSCPGEVDAGSSVDAGSVAASDASVTPPVEAPSSCASVGGRGDASAVLLGVLAVGLISRRRRREVTRI